MTKSVIDLRRVTFAGFWRFSASNFSVFCEEKLVQENNLFKEEEIVAARYENSLSFKKKLTG